MAAYLCSAGRMSAKQIALSGFNGGYFANRLSLKLQSLAVAVKDSFTGGLTSALRTILNGISNGARSIDGTWLLNRMCLVVYRDETVNTTLFYRIVVAVFIYTIMHLLLIFVIYICTTPQRCCISEKILRHLECHSAEAV